MGYVITPHTHHWYKININEILQNHKLVLCDDHSAHVVSLTSAEQPAVNAFTTMP